MSTSPLDTSHVMSQVLSDAPIVSSIESIPDVALGVVLTCLGPRDLQEVVLTGKEMRGKVVTAVTISEPLSIKNFIKQLIEKLGVEKYSAQAALLERISLAITLKEFPSLKMIKVDFLNVKIQLINVLKDVLKIEDRGFFESIQPPEFMGNIFELAEFEANIDIATRRNADLTDICKDLTTAGYIDRAIAVATSRVHDPERHKYLSAISEILTRAGNVERAIEVAKLIHEPSFRDFTLLELSKILNLDLKTDRAIEVAMLIDCDLSRKGALEDIHELLTESGNLKKAATVEALISMPKVVVPEFPRPSRPYPRR